MFCPYFSFERIFIMVFRSRNYQFLQVLIILTVLLAIGGCTAVQTQAPYTGDPYLRPIPDGHAARESSWDRDGGNGDAIGILPGQTRVLADISGPGIIRHIWTTTNASGPYPRTMVIRMYWDGSETPAVEVPYGDFFGVSNGMAANLFSYPISNISEGRSRNCWWSMPFADGAKITMTNEGTETVTALYYYIDYLALDKKPATEERFYANYRQAYPADSPEHYVILETTGSGRFMGCIYGIENNAPGWWGEGDDLIEVDDHEPLRGTGSEDYFCDAWGQREDMTLFHGAPVVEGYSKAGQRSSVYRFHILDPIPFKEKIKFSIEHGHANDRADNLSSVAYWYQVPPAAPQAPMPEMLMRLREKDRTEFIRDKAWLVASEGGDSAVEKLKELFEMTDKDDLRYMIKGLSYYVEGREKPTQEALDGIEKRLAVLQEMVDALPEEEKYSAPVIKLPTDDDSLVPNDAIKSHTILERAAHELRRLQALERGFEPGDELIVEVRDGLGRLMQPPTYEETSDFTNSYAKVEDTRLVGSGARFTYGEADP
jgi:D-arabinan exo alpha-(1,3)/(1,5)-arabinofuranosidase (non-reducing end)